MVIAMKYIIYGTVRYGTVEIRLDSVIGFIDPHFLIISDDIVDAKVDSP